MPSQYWYKAGEEVQKAARVVPESMVIAFFISGSLAFAASIAILFSIGDLHSTLSTATDYPIIQVFYTATKSRGATTAIIVGLMMTSVFSTFGLLASASRITWALARDKGFPFSTYFQYVSVISVACFLNTIFWLFSRLTGNTIFLCEQSFSLPSSPCSLASSISGPRQLSMPWLHFRLSHNTLPMCCQSRSWSGAELKKGLYLTAPFGWANGASWST